MEFKSEEFHKNFKFLLTLFLVIIFFIIVSLIFKSEGSTIETVNLSNKFDSSISKLVINEVCTSNDGVIIANNESYDWVELYNGSEKDIDLKNYGLSDKPDKIKWVFPKTIIKSKSYIIVFLSGIKQGGLLANFSLSSSGGETLSLRKPNGKIVDIFETKKAEKNHSFIKNDKGFWNETSKPTPGFENSLKGYDKFQSSLLSSKKELKITEVLPVNKGNFIDKYGLLSSFIEVTNILDNSVNLNNYFLSDEDNVPFKWNMPNKTLSTGESIVIFTGSGVDDKNSADFKLSSKNGYVVLSKNDNTIIDKVKYDNLTNGHALVWLNNDFYETSNISPGFSNDSNGSNNYSSIYQKQAKDLVINEVMPSNSKFLPQNGYNFYDWIEVKNNSNENINLHDYYLSTDATDEEKWQLPEITLKPNEYYVIFASGDEMLSNGNYKHSNFKLANDDGLFLFKNKKIVDSVFLYEIPANYSYGRGSKEGFYYISIPSPNAKNNEGSKEISYTPEVNTLSGVFNNVNEIKVSFKAPGKIYYTTDGNTPTTGSNLYNGELALTKTAVVKAISVEEGRLPSKVITNSYIINENHTLPVLSLSLDNSDFNKVTRGAWNMELEVSAYSEFYENGRGFAIPCGFKLFGGTTRGLPKQSFALKFKKEYGKSELHYKLFDNRSSSVYNTVVIRSGSQDYSRAAIRDEVATSIVDGVTNLDVQAYKPIILYINGNYYGIYFLREKVDEEFISNHYNVSPKNTDIFRIDGDVTTGSTKKYTNLIDYSNSHDMSKKESYEYVSSQLDIDSFIDFWIAETWITNNDIVNTRFFSNPNIENGKLNMIFYDADFAFYNLKFNYFGFITNPEGIGEKKYNEFGLEEVRTYNNSIIRGLMRNSDFKNRFLERLEYNLKNVWTSKRVNDKISLLYNTLLPEMERNQQRWGLSMDIWNSRIEELKNYASNREKYLISQIKSFFSLNSKEIEERFGG